MSNNRLRELRLESGLLQGALAAKAGVSPSTIGFAERYGYSPSLTVQQKIAKALKRSVDEIWPREEPNVA